MIQQLQDKGNRLPLILGALRGDEWLTYVMHWRAHDDTQEPGRTVYTNNGLQPGLITVAGNGSAEAPTVQPPSSRLEDLAEVGHS